MEIINDYNMFEEIINDVKERCGFTQQEARNWAEEHGESIVDDMWEAYSRYIEENTTAKEDEEEDDE